MSPETIALIAAIAAAVFGAIVHATAQLKVHRDQKLEFSREDFLILMVIALFSGMVFGLSALLFTENTVLIILATAIGAFLGLAGLNRIANMFLEFLASNISKKK